MENFYTNNASSDAPNIGGDASNYASASVAKLEVSPEVQKREVIAQMAFTPYVELKAKRMADRTLSSMDYLYAEERADAVSAYLPDEFYASLPSFYQTLPLVQDNLYLRDAVLQGLMTSTSAAMPHCFVRQGTHEKGCSLMTIVSAPPAQGKSNVTDTAQVLKLIDHDLREQRAARNKEYRDKCRLYEIVLGKIKKDKNLSDEERRQAIASLDEPEVPKCEMVLIASDITKSRFINDLDANGIYPALMTDTELSNMLSANKADYGDQLLLLLKIAEEETIHKSIKQDGEEHYVESPRMSLLTTCVPDQVKMFADSFSTGMGSRLTLIDLPYDNTFRPDLDDVTYELQRRQMEMLQGGVKEMYDELRHGGDRGYSYVLTLSDWQRGLVTQFFSTMTDTMEARYGSAEVKSVVLRKQLDMKRILMQISLMRRYDECGSWAEALGNTCVTPTDRDLGLALYYTHHLIGKCIDVYQRHGMINTIDVEEKAKGRPTRDEIFKTMSREFTRAELYHLVCDTHHFCTKTVQRYLDAWSKAGLIVASGKDKYRKCTAAERKKIGKKSARKAKRTNNQHTRMRNMSATCRNSCTADSLGETIVTTVGNDANA